jgi:glycosyltransferase involved in cell wall biosynthesis
MKSTPLVSIVTPSLNQGAFIEETIQSVLAQDYPNVEYLVVDGGSTDQTRDILARYAQRLSAASEPDDGQASAINRGFRRSRGSILGWINSDDYYETHAVSSAVALLLDEPDVALVYGDATFVDADGRVIGPCSQVSPFDYQRLLHEGDFIAQPAAFFRRDAFEAVGGLDESLHWAMDYDLWLKLGRRYPARYLPRPLARYRWTGRNKTAIGGDARFTELERVGRRHGAAGLAATFRLERCARALRQSGRLAAAAHVGAALMVAARPTGSVLVSPRAIRIAFRLAWQALRPRHV